ncbi:hybrid sensor histidine kinase/response regulator [Baaleninema simplex]|uniref:hybrid sensor histidine kinase/response regulator n=1 Tax=Baaleninema simplex TaxID=2862350 RepID=UPI00036553FC|nr:ATP-binding protein [Baaleninema simplex]
MHSTFDILALGFDQQDPAITTLTSGSPFDENFRAEISIFGDETSAIAALNHHRFDCIAIDTERVGERNPLLALRNAGVKIPVIAVGSHCNGETENANRDLGAIDYFCRDRFTPEGLGIALRYAIQVDLLRRERDRAQQKHHECEEKYRFVIEGSHEGVWDWNPVNNTLRGNDRLCEILGLELETLPRTYEAFCKLIHPGDRARNHQRLREHLDLGVPYRLDLRLQHSNGDYRYCTLRAKVQRDDSGRPIRVAGVINDITERKQIEERIAAQNELLKQHNQELVRQREQIRRQNLAVLEASRMKSAFLATMSHELRTPLNAIIGFSQLLLRKHRDRCDGTFSEKLERILHNGQHLLRLLNDILDRSKLEAGDLELRLQRFDLAELSRATVSEFRPSVERQNLELRYSIELSNPIVVNDRHAVRRIFTNLLSNALKFTEEGAIELRVWEPSSDRIALSVSDTGIGIAPENLKRVFATFEQLDNTSTRTHTGTGLGLAITEALVKMMDGRISVESEVGSGSTFHIELPRQVVASTSTFDERPLPFDRQAFS